MKWNEFLETLGCVIGFFSILGIIYLFYFMITVVAPSLHSVSAN